MLQLGDVGPLLVRLGAGVVSRGPDSSVTWMPSTWSACAAPSCALMKRAPVAALRRETTIAEHVAMSA